MYTFRALCKLCLTAESCCVNVKLQFASTEASPESMFLTVGWNDKFIIDGRRRITGRPIVQCVLEKKVVPQQI